MNILSLFTQRSVHVEAVQLFRYNLYQINRRRKIMASRWYCQRPKMTEIRTDLIFSGVNFTL